MGLSVFLFALVVAFASWTGAAQALDVVPDGPPPEQRATTYNEIVACLSAKGAFKLPPAALQIAQEECEAKVSSITLNEYLAINTGCVLVLDDISRSLCVTGAEQLRAMFVPRTRDAPVAPQSLETAELRAIGSVCPLIRDGLTRSRCLTGVNKLKAVVAPNSGSARVDELDGWCAQAKKASSVVICSDAELRQQAIARNKLFEAARARLSPEDYKALTEDQSRWVKSYTAACGVPLDGPVPTLPVARYVIDCFTRASHARTAELATRLSEPAPAGKPLPTTEEASRPAPSSTEADAEK
jgi:uncharacterized protein YecT (DUF1311 family)